MNDAIERARRATRERMRRSRQSATFCVERAHAAQTMGAGASDDVGCGLAECPTIAADLYWAMGATGCRLDVRSPVRRERTRTNNRRRDVDFCPSDGEWEIELGST